jgi:ribulose-phosphate 3-epimerase
MIKICPSLLSSDISDIFTEIRRIEKIPVSMVHFDIMDGHFVPNLTFGPMLLKSLRDKTKLIFDAHLMVTNPDMYLLPLKEAGADIVSVQAEVVFHLQRTLTKIRELGMKSSVALNPSTSVDFLEYIIDDIDMILLMTVNPGFESQEFIPAMFEKIAEVKKIINRSKRDIFLEVDGGINEKTAPLAIKKGADILVAGSFIFKSGDYKKAVEKLTGK